MDAKIAIFKGKGIRKIIHKNEWWFSITDVVEVLTESPHPRRYWSDLKRQLAESEGYSELYDKIVQLKLREELTDEWKNRGAQEQKDYEILTAEIRLNF